MMMMMNGLENFSSNRLLLDLFCFYGTKHDVPPYLFPSSSRKIFLQDLNPDPVSTEESVLKTDPAIEIDIANLVHNS